MSEEDFMKRQIFAIALVLTMFVGGFILASCGKEECKELQLMGAGDRIHDSYTFANTGVVLTKTEENKFEISGSVDYLSDARVKQEFKIDEDVNHVVAIKVCNCSGNKTNKDEVEIMVNGVRNYDAEHLNGDDYTFIILEANAGTTVTVSVKWNASMEPQVYTIKMADNLQLKSAT